MALLSAGGGREREHTSSLGWRSCCSLINYLGEAGDGGTHKRYVCTECMRSIQELRWAFSYHAATHDAGRTLCSLLLFTAYTTQ